MSKAPRKPTSSAAKAAPAPGKAKAVVDRSYIKPLPRIVVIGESHVAAIDSAVKYSKENKRFEDFAVYSFRKEKGEIEIGNITADEFMALASELTSEDFIVSAVGGNQYAVISTVQNVIDFDVLTGPKDHEIGSDAAQIVPHRAIRELLAKGISGSLGKFLKDLKAVTKANVVHLSAPPPKKDNAFIAEHFEKRFSALGIGKYGPSRPSLRRKCWTIQNHVVRDICEKNDVVFMEPPGRALTSDGFLDPGYYANDATHGNRRYGRDCLVQILQYVHAEIGNVKKHFSDEAKLGRLHSEKRYSPDTAAGAKAG